MRNRIYYTSFSFGDIDRVASIRLHVDEDDHNVEIGDTVVMVDPERIRAWGPVVSIESSEYPEKAVAITVEPRAAFGMVYTP